MRDYDIEALLEILSDHGILVSFDEAKNIAEDFISCYLSNREHEFVAFDVSESNFDKIQRLEKENKNLKIALDKINEFKTVYEDWFYRNHDISYVGVNNGQIVFEK